MDKNMIYKSRRPNTQLRNFAYYILGILEAFFAFRLVFKLLGANPGNMFISFIYSVSGTLITPFRGIFRSAVNQGIETKSVLEPMTIIAMIVYALVVYGIVRLVEILSNSRTP